jgi:hypothetical protein
MSSALIPLGSSALIPLGLKIAYTLFMAVLIPVYWYYYGPTNFLYFCDIALILTLIGMWTENTLLISMCAVGILAPQTLWVLDFIATLVGVPITGMTKYMFRAESSLFLRGLSFFHGWIPFLLLYLVWKVGYNKKALPAWTALAWILIGVCFFLMPGPNPDAGLTPVNINYVWGMSDEVAQTWMPTYAWLAFLFIGMPVLLFIPTHFLLRKLMPKQIHA